MPKSSAYAKAVEGSDVLDYGPTALGRPKYDVANRNPYAQRPVEPTTPEPDPDLYDWGPWTDQLLSFWGERMSPSFSTFSPQAREAAARYVGGQTARTRADTASSLASRGLAGSGAGYQLDSQAQTRGALGLADLSASMSVADEEARRRAAGGAEGMREFGTNVGLQKWLTAQRMPIEKALAEAGIISGGPDYAYQDPWAISGADLNIDMLEQSINALMEQGNLTFKDIMEMAFSSPGGWQMIINLGSKFLG